jgi:hypothetical protein
MKRRIFAWVLLIGFLLLLLNLLVFRFYWQLSMVVYLIIGFAFLLTNGRFNTENRSGAYDPGTAAEDENDGDVYVEPDGAEGEDGTKADDSK